MAFVVTERTAPSIPRPKPLTRDYVIAELRAWADAHDGRTPRIADWNRAHARRKGSVFEAGWPSTQAVIDAFGSWRVGIEAAGLATRAPGAPTYPATCIDCGVPRRSRGGGRCRRCAEYWARNGVEWTPARAAEGRTRASSVNAGRFIARVRDFVELRRQGLSDRQIGERRGTSQAAVANVFSRARARGMDVPKSPHYR